MKRMIQIEMNRALHAGTFYLSLAVGCFISVMQVILCVLPVSFGQIVHFFADESYPPSVFNNWIGGSFSPYYTVYLIVFPLLAVIPHAVTYCTDRKSGYIKNIFLRTDRKSYLCAKYIASFVTAGITVVIPMILNLMLTATMLPSLVPVENGRFLGAGRLFGSLYYDNPYLYIAVFMVLYFIFAGVFASMTLAAYHFLDNTFLVILFAFVIYYAAGVLSSYIRPIEWLRSIDPRVILNIANSYTTGIAVALMILILFFLNAAIFFIRGKRDDCL